MRKVVWRVVWRVVRRAFCDVNLGWERSGKVVRRAARAKARRRDDRNKWRAGQALVNWK